MDASEEAKSKKIRELGDGSLPNKVAEKCNEALEWMKDAEVMRLKTREMHLRNLQEKYYRFLDGLLMARRRPVRLNVIDFDCSFFPEMIKWPSGRRNALLVDLNGSHLRLTHDAIGTAVFCYSKRTIEELEELEQSSSAYMDTNEKIEFS